MNFFQKMKSTLIMPKSYLTDPNMAKFRSYCFMNCRKCSKRIYCAGCYESGGRPFGGECVIAECCKKHNEGYKCGYPATGCKLKYKVMTEMKKSGVTDLHPFNLIFEMPGKFININYKHPDGSVKRPFDDTKVYIWGQYKLPNRSRIYTIIADSENLWIADYDENGDNAEILEHRKYSSDIENE